MGSVIARSASVDRIREAAQRALTISLARGGEILALAQLRITPIITALGDNEQQLNQARADDDAKHAALLARDEESDLEIGSVCDEMWNCMGRPKQSSDYDLIVNGGKNVWTDGDPVKQPFLMFRWSGLLLVGARARPSSRKRSGNPSDDSAQSKLARARIQACSEGSPSARQGI